MDSKIDLIYPEYYTVAHDDGPTKAAHQAAVDVALLGVEPLAEGFDIVEPVFVGGSTQRRAGRVCHPALLPAAADWLLRRLGCTARDRVAGRRFACPASVSWVDVAGGAAGSFDGLADASLDRSRHAPYGLHVDAPAAGRRRGRQRQRRSALTRQRWRRTRRCAASCGVTRVRATRTSCRSSRRHPASRRPRAPIWRALIGSEDRRARMMTR